MKQRAWLVGLLFLLWIPQLLADPQSRSWSHWQFDEHGASLTFTVPSREVTRLPPAADLESALIAHVTPRITLHRGQRDCGLSGRPRPVASTPGQIQLAMRFDCPSDAQGIDRLSVAAFFEYAGSHIHFARVTGTTGQHEMLLNRHQIEWTLAAAQPQGHTVWTSYLRLGVEHILVGLDHIAFLLALLLVQRGWRSLLASISGFTLGHSLTLALVVMGSAQPLSHRVEAGIGFTVALVAAEYFAGRGLPPKRLALTASALLLMCIPLTGFHTTPPWLWYLGLALVAGCYLIQTQSSASQRLAVALLFGAVHGFGFAGVLQEVGWPPSQQLLALAAFNIGVEVGQLIIVGALLASMALYSQLFTPTLRLWCSDTCAGLLVALGLFWVVTRSVI